MSLDKAIANGKEKRKPFRKSKSFDSSCRNHGSCEYCENKRRFFDKKKRDAADKDLKHFLDPNSIFYDEEYEQFYDCDFAK